jgi:hypothetical protein
VSAHGPVVVVAGDVCIDWLSIPVEPLVADGVPNPGMNWQLRGGRHMFALRGGAWLTADLIDNALSNRAIVRMPEPVDAIASVPPDKIIHSMLVLDPGERVRADKTVRTWVVTRFDGFAGPRDRRPPEVKAIESDPPRADVVLLDDAGNGFRDSTKWPRALDGKPGIVIWKVRRPLCEGELWKKLEADHLPHTIAILSADELRGQGAKVTRQLSWERTATDLVVNIAHSPDLHGLRKCRFLVIPLGIEGAVLVQCGNNTIESAHLWYVPALMEGELIERSQGGMTGFGSVFAAAITTEVADALGKGASAEAVAPTLRAAVPRGLGAMHSMLEHAFGPCMAPDSTEGRDVLQPPVYPIEKVFRPPSKPFPLCDVALPVLPAPPVADRQSTDAEYSVKVREYHEKVVEYRAWRILESKRVRPLSELAADIVRRGVDKVIAEIPLARFDQLETAERSEIESYRSIRNLLQQFLADPKPERPLCLGVFGPPGAGKGFGVTQVARSLAGDRIEKIDVNVSQWNEPAHLVPVLHRVRDVALRGKVPIVFFDEFDCELAGTELGWLRYFLAPMQDGVFADGVSTHQIGKAVFVFAGGTVERFAQLQAKLGQSGEKATDEKVKKAKLPDFVSRLRGYVDVFPFDPPLSTNLIRRALVLRSLISRRYKTLIDAAGGVRIDDGVLRAFLHVPEYRHGARSLEAILEMSRLLNQRYFDPSLLPPKEQLTLHVDGNVFLRRVQHHHALGAQLERLAQLIHERFLHAELKDGKKKLGDRPSLRPWADLDELFRNSSREQAAYYPTLLAAIGCNIEEGLSTSPVILTSEEIDRLARMEHERWIEERRLKQPDHPDLKPWDKLDDETKQKDIGTIEALPELLNAVGLSLKRLV